MRVLFPEGVYEMETPPDFDEWLNTPVEGTLEYKGFRATYHHGETDIDRHKLFGELSTNTRNVGFVMQGDTLEELEAEFHEMTDDFLLSLVDHRRRYRSPIEFYTSDPAILSYFYSHYGKPGRVKRGGRRLRMCLPEVCSQGLSMSAA
jgi:hypothetical protein